MVYCRSRETLFLIYTGAHLVVFFKLEIQKVSLTKLFILKLDKQLEYFNKKNQHTPRKKEKYIGIKQLRNIL